MAAARKILRGSDPDLWPPTSASERRARICRRLGWERPFLPHSERAPAWISKQPRHLLWAQSSAIERGPRVGSDVGD